MPFTCALHTYFRTPDINQVRLEGLQRVEYLDSLQGRVRKVEAGETVTFPEEVLPPVPPRTSNLFSTLPHAGGFSIAIGCSIRGLSRRNDDSMTCLSPSERMCGL